MKKAAKAALSLYFVTVSDSTAAAVVIFDTTERPTEVAHIDPLELMENLEFVVPAQTSFLRLTPGAFLRHLATALFASHMPQAFEVENSAPFVISLGKGSYPRDDSGSGACGMVTGGGTKTFSFLRFLPMRPPEGGCSICIYSTTENPIWLPVRLLQMR